MLAVIGCDKPAPAVPAPSIHAVDPIHGHLLRAQPKLPTVKVLVDREELQAEVAIRSVEIATGMMFRKNMLENEAMLFVFSRPAPRSFYMRNCFVPLSGAYISPSGEILQVFDMQPHDERAILSMSDDIQFVLEVPQGWFARHRIGVGSMVRTEHGSLRETFRNWPVQPQ
jgi:uncharacterized membrane protein (UPF0127 family)